MAKRGWRPSQLVPNDALHGEMMRALQSLAAAAET